MNVSAEGFLDCSAGEFLICSAAGYVIRSAGGFLSWRCCSGLTVGRFPNCSADELLNCSVGELLNCSVGEFLNCSAGEFLNCSAGRFLNCSAGKFLNFSAGGKFFAGRFRNCSVPDAAAEELADFSVSLPSDWNSDWTPNTLSPSEKVPPPDWSTGFLRGDIGSGLFDLSSSWATGISVDLSSNPALSAFAASTGMLENGARPQWMTGLSSALPSPLLSSCSSSRTAACPASSSANWSVPTSSVGLQDRCCVVSLLLLLCCC